MCEDMAAYGMFCPFINLALGALASCRRVLVGAAGHSLNRLAVWRLGESVFEMRLQPTTSG